MEISAFQPYAWDILLNPSMLLPYYHVPVPENYVHWRETPESHIYSADIPGVRKEEIKVELEDSKYLIIRTEAVGDANQSSEAVAEAGPPRRFIRKFRLPGRVDVDGISAGYEDGVLRITVPRRGFHIHLADLTDRLEVTARAA